MLFQYPILGSGHGNLRAFGAWNSGQTTFSTLSSGLVTETPASTSPYGTLAPALSVPYPRVWSRKPVVFGRLASPHQTAFSTLSSGLVTETTMTRP